MGSCLCDPLQSFYPMVFSFLFAVACAYECEATGGVVTVDVKEYDSQGVLSRFSLLFLCHVISVVGNILSSLHR